MADASNIAGCKGKVYEILIPCKAIIEFELNGAKQRGLLFSNHFFTADGAALPLHAIIIDHLKVGDTVIFDAHIFDKSGKDACGWYIKAAWKESQDSDVQAGGSGGGKNSVQVPHISIRSGRISEILGPRKGVLTFDKGDGTEERVFFLASKFYLFGKRLNTKQHLGSVLSENDPVQFEANPCEANDKSEYCSWFAILVWKGFKPVDIAPSGFSKPELDDQQESPSPPVKKNDYTSATPQENAEAHLGRIAEIFNESHAIVFWQVRENAWQSVLFTRDVASIYGFSLKDKDLRTVFKKNWVVKFLAKPADKALGVKWIATKVWIDDNLLK